MGNCKAIDTAELKAMIAALQAEIAAENAKM
ncbi:hypothetical protein OIHEL45_20646 [Sulfitobacter indolifex HEL-45]|uniref:Uncharacterized protein n=1 Tax=Sulfitobacter indolifex HEL-45 TaxID=391624 RepID=A0ABP2D685_9RHOB|nr:hypothetical protein OIHEL45_20646 [Sulfitobacter indolifex HEL-45]